MLEQARRDAQRWGVTLAADLTGGARQALSGRILTLDGTVNARQTITSVVDANQRPYARVEEPTPVQVDLHQLRVSYEGSRWPALLATLNPAKEATALRPVLDSQLFGLLARIPLTCMPCSLPLRVTGPQGTVAAGTLPIKRVVPGLFLFYWTRPSGRQSYRDRVRPREE